MLRTSSLALAAVISCLSIGIAQADGLDNCTAEPKVKWKSIEDVTKMATEQGLTVSKAKVEGSCYELYTTDKEGKLWEMFFNPVDGALVEKEAKG